MDDDENLYDEFGNYIGPQVSDGESSEGERGDVTMMDQDEVMIGEPLDEEESGMPFVTSTAIVLHEDKKYYPSAEEVYGSDVEALVQEEDTQPLNQPLIEPVKTKTFQTSSLDEKDLPETRFSKKMMLDLFHAKDRIRNIAIVGHLHHGKTSLMDVLVEETHRVAFSVENQERYTDPHLLERERGCSIKCQPMSFLLPSSNDTSHVFHVLDTPGHVNFIDEVACALRLVDGVVVVVDAVEGVMVNTEKVIKMAIQEQLPLTLVVNKVDRLILELKLPPLDAYFKLRLTIEEVNSFISSCGSSYRVSPEMGNVCFASCSMGWCFTLESFSKLYQEYGNGSKSRETSLKNHKEFAKRLWGDIYFSPRTRKFSRSASEIEDATRTFVHFILEPIYKLYSIIVGEEPEDLKKALASLGIYLHKSEYRMDVKPLLKVVTRKFFGTFSAFADMCIDHIPNPGASAEMKIERNYKGPLNSNVAKAMLECDPNGPLVIQVTKLYPSPDGSDFYAFGRVYSGTVRKGTGLTVLGEEYVNGNEVEGASNPMAEDVWVYQTRYKIPVGDAGVPAGNMVLLGGVDGTIFKYATIFGQNDNNEEEAEELGVFRPLNYGTSAVVKVAIEPINPAELPKLLSGLRKVNKSYPLLTVRVQESGEHILYGTGELFLDCIMHDLREMYAGIEVKVSDPEVKFCETVMETSAIKCFANSLNKRNKLTMICEPLEKGLGDDIENGQVSILNSSKEVVSQFLQKKYGWDILAARSIWAFGPKDEGPNILLDDSLPSETDKKLLYSVQESIRTGFSWAMTEGPLCDEPIRNVKFKILDGTIASETFHRAAGQIIPMARRVCYSSFLTATPRLLEPVYYVEIQTPADCVDATYNVLNRRRGHVTKHVIRGGTPMNIVQAYLPVMDSYGFETDLRTHTLGQAFCQSVFDHWQLVPGDPLDKDIVLRALEPSPAQHLARDFMLKTRRRKGLSEDVTMQKFFDDPMLLELAKSSGTLI